MARSFTAASVQYGSYAGAVVTAAPVTLAAWFNPTSTTLGASKDILNITASASAGDCFRLNINGTAAGDPIRAITQSSGTAAIAVSTAGPNGVADAWYHGAAVFGAADNRVAYFNGANSATETTSITPGTMNSTSIANNKANSINNALFDGLIAEAAIWTVALTAAEIALLALGYSPRLVRPDMLVAYWPLIGATSPEIDIRNAQAMTLTGTPPAAAHCRIFNPHRRWNRSIPAAAAGGVFTPYYYHRLIAGGMAGETA